MSKHIHKSREEIIKRRNQAMLLVLTSLVVLLYLVAFVRVGG